MRFRRLGRADWLQGQCRHLYRDIVLHGGVWQCSIFLSFVWLIPKLQPERIQGLSYTITSDVWSLGVTLIEVAQHRFPFGQTEDGGGHARAGLIDLLTYIVRQPIPELKDEPELGIKWSDNFKYFVACW